MWGYLLLDMVFYGGRLSPEKTDEILQLIGPEKHLTVIFTIEPPDISTTQRLAELRRIGKGVLLATPTDVDALAQGRWSLLQMICYKLCASLLLGQNDQQITYDDYLFKSFVTTISLKLADLASFQLEDAIAIQCLPASKWKAHPITNDLTASVGRKDLSLLLGTSASGKTTLALACGKARAEAGDKVFFIDIGATADDRLLPIAWHILLTLQLKQSTLLILDDLQSNPRVAANLIAWATLLQHIGFLGRLRILGVAWPEFAAHAFLVAREADIHIVAASQVAPALIDEFRPQLTNTQLEFALTASENDLLLLHLTLDTLQKAPQERSALSHTVLASLYWTEKTRTLRTSQHIAKRAVLVAATLGKYECEVSVDFLILQAGIAQEDINDICRCKLLRKAGTRLHAGHRSLCEFIAAWLQTACVEESATGAPELPAAETIVLNYLRSLEPHEIWPILELIRMHAGFRASDELREAGRIMTDSWQAMEAIIERIAEQQRQDPTWGAIPSSAMFATETLCAVGRRSAAERSIAFIKSCYSVADGELTISTADLGTNNDFVQIRERMEQEDAVTDIYAKSTIFEAGASVDAALLNSGPGA